MKTIKEQTGFSAIIIIAIIGAVLLIGLLGYVVYNQFFANYDDASSIVEQSPIASDVNTNESITVEETSDLDGALESLNQIDDKSTVSDTKLIDNHLSEF